VRLATKLANLRVNLPGLEAVRKALQFGTEDIEAADSAATVKPEKPVSLSFRDVSFQYPGQSGLALSAVTAEIPAGKLVGVFGPSGAGKSTLLNILLGLLRPDKGDVLVDGRSIFEDLDNWRRQIGFVAQDPVLLTTTIRDNITFGRKRPDEDESIRRALRLAHLEEFVDSLPKKLDTSVGEKGSLLSGGQRQRVAIARALYAQPGVLILDEPASALDAAVSSAIDTSLENLRGQTTVVVVTHRPATIERCDIVLFVDQGRLQGCGTLPQLMGQPDFARLVKLAMLSEGSSEETLVPLS
jgi:ABC-type multidrug transport system fused ATPase/permease subunit